ncbi:MAG: DUF1963 domain-containing protein [Thermodesulfobacteriota bacterium]
MPTCASIEFTRSPVPVTQPVTKFGGQPVWVTGPQWPFSPSTGQPMCFISQIELTAELFGPCDARMAYVFMTDHPDVDNSWEPDGGENAVILQPGTSRARIEPLRQGPSLYCMVRSRWSRYLVEEPCEFRVALTYHDDPLFVPESTRMHWSENECETYAAALDGNKIGGSPLFIQGDEFPGDGTWQLLMQLDSTKVPFYINFGDMGTGYAFLSEDRTLGRFLWQCS